MATSGSASFNLNLTEIIEEAYELLGLIPRSGNDYRSARRSLDLLFIEFSNRGTNFWTLDENTTTTVAGTQSYTLEADVLDVVDVYTRTGTGTSQQDVELVRTSPSQWMEIPNKLQQGRPTRVWVDKQRDAPVLRVWPVPDDVYTLVWWELTRVEDTGSPGTNTVDAPWRFIPAITAGLAWKLAIKRAPDKVQLLKPTFEEAWALAEASDRDRSSFILRPNLRPYQR